MAFCPKCGAEYRDGYTSCKACKTTLVSEQPEDFSQPPTNWQLLWHKLRASAADSSSLGLRIELLAWVIILLIAIYSLLILGVRISTTIGVSSEFPALDSYAWYGAFPAEL